MNRYEWIQFFILYFTACAIEYIESSTKNFKIKMIESLEIISNSLKTIQTSS